MSEFAGVNDLSIDLSYGNSLSQGHIDDNKRRELEARERVVIARRRTFEIGQLAALNLINSGSLPDATLLKSHFRKSFFRRVDVLDRVTPVLSGWLIASQSYDMTKYSLRESPTYQYQGLIMSINGSLHGFQAVSEKIDPSSQVHEYDSKQNRILFEDPAYDPLSWQPLGSALLNTYDDSFLGYGNHESSDIEGKIQRSIGALVLNKTGV